MGIFCLELNRVIVDREGDGRHLVEDVKPWCCRNIVELWGGPKKMGDLLRNTSADTGMVINRISEVVPCPIRVHFLSEERATVGSLIPLGGPQQPAKQISSIKGLSRSTSNT